MKFALQYLLFPVAPLLCCISLNASPADSIPLIRKILHAPNSGFLIRAGSGFWRGGTEFGDQSYEAAGIPVAGEIACKFRFVEAAYRRTFGSLPLGIDYPIVLLDNKASTAFASIRRPYLNTLNGHEFLTTLHFSFRHTPLFIKGGIGRFKSTRLPSKVTFASGRTEYTSTAPDQASSRMLGFGFSQGNFFAALEYRLLNWENPVFNYFQPTHFWGFQLGAQLATPGGHALDNCRIDYEERLHRVSLSVGRSMLLAPWKGRAAAAQTYIEAAVRIKPRWSIAAYFLPQPNGFGSDKKEPEFELIYNGFTQALVAHFYDTHSEIQYYQLRTDYSFDPFRNFSWLLSGGIGRYKIDQIGGYYNSLTGVASKPLIKQQKTLGLVAGGGFDFRIFQCRILLHDPFGEYPAFLEWSMGIRLLFGKMRA